MTRLCIPLCLCCHCFCFSVRSAGRFAGLDGPGVLPPEGQEAVKAEYTRWTGVWEKLLRGDPADPSNTQQMQAIDAAAKLAAYRLTWGLERERGKIDEVFNDFNHTLEAFHNGKEKTQKTSELFTKQIIAHASEVLKTNKAVNRITAPGS